MTGTIIRFAGVPGIVVIAAGLVIPFERGAPMAAWTQVAVGAIVFLGGAAVAMRNADAARGRRIALHSSLLVAATAVAFAASATALSRPDALRWAVLAGIAAATALPLLVDRARGFFASALLFGAVAGLALPWSSAERVRWAARSWEARTSLAVEAPREIRRLRCRASTLRERCERAASERAMDRAARTLSDLGLALGREDRWADDALALAIFTAPSVRRPLWPAVRRIEEAGFFPEPWTRERMRPPVVPRLCPESDSPEAHVLYPLLRAYEDAVAVEADASAAAGFLDATLERLHALGCEGYLREWEGVLLWRRSRLALATGDAELARSAARDALSRAGRVTEGFRTSVEHFLALPLEAKEPARLFGEWEVCQPCLDEESCAPSIRARCENTRSRLLREHADSPFAALVR